MLSSQDIIRVWELGQNKPLWYRALLMLAPAFPQKTLFELAVLSIGQRNLQLLRLHQQLFGDRLEAVVTCAHCGENLEFSINVETLCAVNSPPHLQYVWESESYKIIFRLLNSNDFANVQPLSDVDLARQALLDACILEAHQDGQAVLASTLPTTVVTEFGDHLWQCDPLAEIRLNMTCVACNVSWSPMLDVVTFLWTELSAEAQRLLDEVHTLAAAYGWSEAEILSMPPIRRNHYLGQV